MDKRKIIIGVCVLVVLIIIVQVVRRQTSGQDYIFDKKKNIRLHDITVTLTPADFSDANVKKYFSGNVANPYTIKFFDSIMTKFKDVKDLDQHMEAAREYIFSHLPQDEAEKLFALYKKYIKYQQDIGGESKSWGIPKGPEEAIAYLRKLQEYRRDFFGKDTADILFGADIKSKEYPIRRMSIVADGDMYAKDKLVKLKKLNGDMWGDEAEEIEGYTKPYTRYQDMMEIYKKDLSEMSEQDKTGRITEIRQAIFPPEVVKRLEDVDRQLKDEKSREDGYRALEEKILKDQSLTAEQREQKLKDTQNQMFGEEADAFRRRENIRKGLFEKQEQ
ncbi:MAG: lipase chaperone family protein [Spirochaetes bacterium]|jgi:lipase chaperone LimK|nr:lipase chaperone family protein [Spirochaetota bacterium]